MQAPLLEAEYRGRGLQRSRCLLTIHNAAYQGWAGADVLSAAGLTPERVAQLPDSAAAALLPGGSAAAAPGTPHGSLLRAGIACAARVTTVSPTYAREVAVDAELSCGLQVCLQSARSSGWQ